MENHILISLGHDCCVAYQLQKFGLRSMSLPFDWIRLNLTNLEHILNNNFQFFTDDKYLIKDNIDHLNKFPLLDENWKDTNNTKNLIVSNTYYNIKFYHDFDSEKDFEEQIINFKIKYSRRIDRFNKICKDSSIKKTFIRICKNPKEKEILENILCEYCGNDNFYLKIIIQDNKQKFQSWKKEELDWNSIFQDICSMNLI
jgi:hypothetical protein